MTQGQSTDTKILILENTHTGKEFELLRSNSTVFLHW